MPNKNLNKSINTKRTFFSRINGLSSKARFIIVILFIAVLGGGYYTYRSFAATNYIISQGGSRDTSVGSFSNTPDKDCGYSGAVPEPQKNNQLVQGIICKSGPDSLYTINFCSSFLRCGDGLYLQSGAVNYAGRNVQMCSYLKASSPNTKFVFALSDRTSSKKFYEKATVAIPTDRYVSVCSDWVRVPSNVTNGVEGIVLIQTQATQAVGGFWGTLTLQSDSPLPSAPATPSK